MEVYDEPAYNLVRYVTPMGITIDTTKTTIVEPLRINLENLVKIKI